VRTAHFAIIDAVSRYVGFRVSVTLALFFAPTDRNREIIRISPARTKRLGAEWRINFIISPVLPRVVLFGWPSVDLRGAAHSWQKSFIPVAISMPMATNA
jgi:hypothetical protein